MSFRGLSFTPGTVTLKKARVQHWCCECVARIEPGEHYEHVTCLSEDRFWVQFKTCWPCAETRDSFLEDMEDDDREFMTFGYLQEGMREFC